MAASRAAASPAAAWAVPCLEAASQAVACLEAAFPAACLEASFLEAAFPEAAFPEAAFPEAASLAEACRDEACPAEACPEASFLAVACPPEAFPEAACRDVACPEVACREVACLAVRLGMAASQVLTICDQGRRFGRQEGAQRMQTCQNGPQLLIAQAQRACQRRDEAEQWAHTKTQTRLKAQGVVDRVSSATVP